MFSHFKLISTKFDISRYCNDATPPTEAEQILSAFDCKNEKIENGIYIGCQTQTKNGHTCQNWQAAAKSQSLQSEKLPNHNYCRNLEPNKADGKIW